jgi:hypothetical protein
MRILILGLFLIYSQFVLAQRVDEKETDFQSYIIEHHFQHPDVIYTSDQNRFSAFNNDSLMVYSMVVPYNFYELPVLKSPTREKMDTTILMKHNHYDAVYFEKSKDSVKVFGYYYGDSLKTSFISAKSTDSKKGRQLFNELLLSYITYSPAYVNSFEKMGISFDYKKYDLNIGKGLVENSVSFKSIKDNKLNIFCGLVDLNMEQINDDLFAPAKDNEYLRMDEFTRVKARYESQGGVTTINSFIGCENETYYLVALIQDKYPEHLELFNKILEEIRCK